MFGDPPIALIVILAHRHRPGSGSDGELGLVGGPADERGGTVEAEQDEGGLPVGSGRRGARVDAVRPDVGVAVLGGRDDAVGMWGPIDRRDELIVLCSAVESAKVC